MKVSNRVTFGIRADKLVPDEVTAALGITPSKAFAKDDVYKSKNGMRCQPWGVWSVSSEGIVKTNSLDEHILCILGMLEPKRSMLSRYLLDSDYLVQARIWQIGYSFVIPSHLLGRLSNLCALINFSVFDEMEIKGDASIS